jgi:hypothetical protein
VIYNWGDTVTSAEVYPDANGWVNLSASHVYSTPGIYTPSIEVLQEMSYQIGLATSDTLDVNALAGIINGPTGYVPDSGSFNVNTTVPDSLSTYDPGWSTKWTLTDSNGITVPGSSVSNINYQPNSGLLTATISYGSLTSGDQYGITLDILDNNGNVISSEVYDYVTAQ